ncbi:MAG: nodulation protein NfeD [candidate division Zixibacteria bacterium]|nr:nodulation protein NfeD [candidate division Zixibacteria bacterium]
MRLRMIITAIIWLLFSTFVISTYAAKENQSITISDDSTSKTLSDTTHKDSADSTYEALVYTIRINGAIGTVTNDRIKLAIEKAENNDAELLVIFLDTPGGFTKPTWSICKNILNSHIPVCMYIAPSGARAGSAGVYMTYSSHFAAMAPSTNIGAAHPVSGGGKEIDSVMQEKITNDAVAQIRAAAEEHGRNAEWAENAVRESVSITDREALELNVIEFRAKNLDDLLGQINGQTIKLPRETRTMNLASTRVVTLEITLVHKILKIITQPDIAFILFSLGSLGIVLELYSPGTILPGVVGAICLILSFYAFQALPINYAGLALIVLAIILFIAEIKVVSHGILTIGGVISLFFGGLMLIDTADPNLQISLSVLVAVVVIIGIVAAIASYLVIKAAQRQPSTGEKGMIGKTAEVRTNGMVYVDGALWKVTTFEKLNEGDKVKIIGMDKLTLKVKKIET